MVENQVMSKACEICNSEYLVDSKYCNCGCKNTSDSQFCEECGTELKDSEEKIKTIVRNICPNCGAIAYEEDKFCAECGQKL